MLIELFGQNFESFKDEFRLSMRAADIDPGDERGVVQVQLDGEEQPLRLLRCAAVYGPNASGKSNLLRAAHALQYLLGTSAQLASDDPLAPYEPFLLDASNPQRPVMLGLRAVVHRRVYEYRIEFERTRFTREELIELRPDGPRPLFTREKQNVDGPWTRNEQFELLAKSFRPNGLLLSLADRLAPDLANGITVGFRRLLGYRDAAWMGPGLIYGAQTAARRAVSDEGFGNWLVRWLQDADVGIVNCVAEKMPDEPRRDDEDAEHARPKIEFTLNLLHAGPRGPVKMSYLQESMGTRKMIELAPLIHELTCADEVRAYFVDEIGASLHPHLLEALVRHLNCEVSPESVRGQLIFATQETTLLDAEARDATLRRDQVYFTEKDAGGASHLYSLAEFKERNNLNLRRRYLGGRYGALPAIGRLGG